MFELFDPREDVRRSRGSLPHWWQPGVTYFVTFRTADSVPQPLQRAWRLRREDWLRRAGVDPSQPDWRRRLREYPDLQEDFDKLFQREFLEYLDRGHGDCPLRFPAQARIVGETLRHFDGERYNLAAFVVMPNHVHILAGLLGATEIEAQCSSWKKFSALKLNKSLGRKGRFWQEESFDHLIRSSEEFERCREYIEANPVKAGLTEGEYLLSVRAQTAASRSPDGDDA